jgi:hypothetical protein
MLTLSEIARAVNGRIVGREVRAPSPGHSAADDGMAIKIAADAPDGFVVHLFNGSGDAEVLAAKDYVRERLGVSQFEPKAKTMNGRVDETIRRIKARAKSEPRAPIIAEYSYTTAEGELIYQVVREAPKSFKQRRPRPGGGWIWNRGDTPEVLYRLPELLQYESATVFFCEGEADADRLAEAGLISTTVSGDAADKWTPELAEPLRDRDVFVLRDNDDAGLKRATAAAQALHGVAKTVRVILLPGLPPRGDVSDWLKAGHSLAELEAACLATPLYEPTAEAPLGETPASPEEHEALGEWDAGEDDGEIPPRQWLLGNVFCRGYISSLLGDGSIGKSALRLVQYLAAMTGRPLSGEYVFVRSKVLLISLEDSRDEVRRRIKAACLHHGIDRAELKGRLFVVTASGDDIGKIMMTDPAKGQLMVGKLAGRISTPSALAASILSRSILSSRRTAAPRTTTWRSTP